MFITVLSGSEIKSVFINGIEDISVSLRAHLLPEEEIAEMKKHDEEIGVVNDDYLHQYIGEITLNKEKVYFYIFKHKIGEENFNDEMMIAFQTGLIGMIHNFIQNKPEDTLFYPLMLDSMLTKEFFSSEIKTLRDQLFNPQNSEEK